jgi:hypothetical protein
MSTSRRRGFCAALRGIVKTCASVGHALLPSAVSLTTLIRHCLGLGKALGRIGAAGLQESNGDGFSRWFLVCSPTHDQPRSRRAS